MAAVCSCLFAPEPAIAILNFSFTLTVVPVTVPSQPTHWLVRGSPPLSVAVGVGPGQPSEGYRWERAVVALVVGVVVAVLTVVCVVVTVVVVAVEVVVVIVRRRPL